MAREGVATPEQSERSPPAGHRPRPMQRDIGYDMQMEDYFYLHDDQFNVTGVVNLQGQLVERYDYDDFGAPTIMNAGGTVLAASAIGNPYLWNGRRLDSESKLYYYRTRYMEPSTGQFTTRDIIGIWGDPRNLGSGRAYVAGNPWSYFDPYGLQTVEDRDEDWRNVHCTVNPEECIGDEGKDEGGVPPSVDPTPPDPPMLEPWDPSSECFAPYESYYSKCRDYYTSQGLDPGRACDVYLTVVNSGFYSCRNEDPNRPLRPIPGYGYWDSWTDLAYEWEPWFDYGIDLAVTAGLGAGTGMLGSAIQTGIKESGRQFLKSSKGRKLLAELIGVAGTLIQKAKNALLGSSHDPDQRETNGNPHMRKTDRSH